MKKLLLPLLAILLSATTERPAPDLSSCKGLRAHHDYALFFAVDDYAPGSGFDDLSKPIANAQAIATELRERYGFETEIVKNPTLDQISAKLREYQAFFAKNPQGQYPSTGQLLIYFSGHGISQDNNGYFVPADGNAQKLYSTAFAYEIWRPFIDRIDCRHILVAIDACYSVTFDPDWYNKKMDPNEHTRPNELSEGDKLLLANESDKSRILWCSDGSEDKVPEQSNFARKFLEGLRNGPRQDGILTSEGLEGFLRFCSPKPRLNTFGGDEDGSFLFVQKTGFATADPALQTQTADLEKDLAAWKTAKAANTLAAYQEYLTRFPNGEFRDNAQTAMNTINADPALRRDDLAWDVAVEKNTPQGYQKYLADYPSGRHAVEANAKITAPTASGPTADGMVFVKGGTFQMGCTSEQQDCGGDEKPVHTVTVGDFYIGQFEVTQAEWRKVMGKDPPELYNSGCDDCPVENVSWNDVQEFIKKLNQQTGRQYRLPTEAEWEYAARGGNKTKNSLYAGGNNLDEVAWYNSNYSAGNTFGAQKTTRPVGKKQPNELGLYDMSGNVYEWCSDWYGAYPSGPQTNPTGPSSGSFRVFRGRSWYDLPQYCRVALRNFDAPGYRYSNLGFRLARTN